MATIMTVTGPISSDQLGFTLMHEHLFLDLMRDSWSGNGYLNDPELTYLELIRYKNAGGVTVVDQTNGGLRGNDHDLLPIAHPLAVREMADRTGLNIILGTGWYRDTYYEPSMWRKKTDELADDMVRELNEGIEGTDVRAGIIGEMGAHFNWLSAIEERVLRAAARAHKETGVTITTHATRGPVGIEQLDVLQQEGVDPRRVSIGHAQSHPHHDYHAEIARRGAYLSFDRMGKLGGPDGYDRQLLLKILRQAIDAGLIDHLLFSHDVCYRADYHLYGGTGYDFVSTNSMSIMSELGLSEEQMHRIMVENPRRVLTGED